MWKRTVRKRTICKTTLLSSFVIAAALCCDVGVQAADALKLQCPVCGKAAGKEHSAEHNGGTVCFCCDRCSNSFAARTKDFAAKANAQLVASGQFKEVKCPLEGYRLNPLTAIEVAGVKVTFCCKGCKNVVAHANRDEQIDLVFNDKAFKKGFERTAGEAKQR